jgi:hypothetical protein
MALVFKVLIKSLELDHNLVKDINFVLRICQIAFSNCAVYEIKIQSLLKNILNFLYEMKNEYKEIILENAMFFNIKKIYNSLNGLTNQNYYENTNEITKYLRIL